jgi:CelD/BcsL family acetyltransferase involved in cellulose biosynthesis
LNLPSLLESRANGRTEVRYKLIENLLEIQSLSFRWDCLLEQSSCNRAFSCSKWFLAACRHDRTLCPLVVVAFENYRLVGVLPLVYRKNDATVSFASPMCDYNDSIVTLGDLTVQNGLLKLAINAARNCNLVLTDLRPDSNCVRAAKALATEGGTPLVYEQCRPCLCIKLLGTFEEYLSGRSRRFRKGLRRIQKNANENCLEVRLLRAQTFKPIAVAELFLSLNFGRFGSSSRFGSPQAQQLIRDLIPALFVENRLDVFVLLEAGKAVAIDLCMRGFKSLCTWNGGFLREAAHWSPGRLLLAAEIRHAYSANLDEFDLLRGMHSYKTSWATHSRSTGNVCFVPSAAM